MIILPLAQDSIPYRFGVARGGNCLHCHGSGSVRKPPARCRYARRPSPAAAGPTGARRRNGMNPVSAIQSGVSMHPNQPTANEMLCAVGLATEETVFMMPGNAKANARTAAITRNAGLARPSENV